MQTLLNFSDLYGHQPGSKAGSQVASSLSSASGLSAASGPAANAPVTALLLMLGLLVAVRVLWEMAD